MLELECCLASSSHVVRWSNVSFLHRDKTSTCLQHVAYRNMQLLLGSSEALSLSLLLPPFLTLPPSLTLTNSSLNPSNYLPPSPLPLPSLSSLPLPPPSPPPSLSPSSLPLPPPSTCFLSQILYLLGPFLSFLPPQIKLPPDASGPCRPRTKNP